MFDTVLVPLDGSAGDDAALPVAIDEALRHGARLVLAYTVIRPEPCQRADCAGGQWAPAIAHEAVQPENCEECQAARRYLNDLRHRHHLPGDVETVVLVGDPVHQVAQEAASRLRSLVVLAAIADRAPRTAAHADRAHRLLTAGRCQLLLVTREPEPRLCCADEIHESTQDLASVAG